MRKMIHVATATHDVMQALARESGQTFQDLVDEAIAHLLKKHKRPVTLKDMLRESLAGPDKNSGKAASRRRPA